MTKISILTALSSGLVAAALTLASPVPAASGVGRGPAGGTGGHGPGGHSPTPIAPVGSGRATVHGPTVRAGLPITPVCCAA